MKGQIKVELGGKLRGLQFGGGCLRRYCKAMGTDLDGVDLIFKPGPRRMEATSNLVFAAMQNYCEIKDEDMDFNMAQMELWLDEAPQEIAAKIIDAFMETVPLSEGKPSAGAKKKSASKPSTKGATKRG